MAVGGASAGVDLMGIGRVQHACCWSEGAGIAEFDLIEANEAFAAQALAVELLEWDWNQ